MSAYQIITADCLAALAAMPDASVDAVVTDPPYSSGGLYHGARTADTRAKYINSGSSSKALPGFSGDARDGRSYAYWCALWLGECLRIAKPGSVLCVFTDWRQLPSTTDAVQAGGWTWRGIVPWYKPIHRPMQGRFSNACEYVVWATAGPRPLEGATFTGFYQESAPQDREHVTQKPVELLSHLVGICPPGGIVLDPFAGSGTTGVAALAEGRRFVGVEINAEYAAIARARCAAAAAAPRLDLAPPPAASEAAPLAAPTLDLFASAEAAP